MIRKMAIALALLLLLGPWAAFLSAAAPEGQMTWAVHVSLAPTWFDPAETQGVIVPFMVLYALHDALVKPMPGQPMAPSVAESWLACTSVASLVTGPAMARSTGATNQRELILMNTLLQREAGACERIAKRSAGARL